MNGNFWKILAVISFLLTVFAVVFSIWSHSENNKKARLKILDDENRQVLVLKNDIKNLKVFYRDKSIENGLASSHVKIWNAGDKAIKSSSLLSDLYIQAYPRNLNIYEVQIENLSRDSIEFEISSDDIKNGLIPIKFRAIMQSDIIALKILHSYSEEISFDLVGYIEDQVGPYKYKKEFEEEIFSHNSLILEAIINFLIGLQLLMSSSLFFYVTHFSKKFRKDNHFLLRKKLYTSLYVIVFITSIWSIVYGIKVANIYFFSPYNIVK